MVLHKANRPEILEVVRLNHLPRPWPKTGDVLIKMLEFAGPLAQGVIDQFLFFVLVCYPPLSPQGPSAPVPGRPGRSRGAPGALLGSCQGSPEPRGAPKGTPRTLQGRPRDPPGPSQSSQGHPSELPGCPRIPRGLPQRPPGRPKYNSRPPLSKKWCKQKRFSMFSKAPNDP